MNARKISALFAMGNKAKFCEIFACALFVIFVEREIHAQSVTAPVVLPSAPSPVGGRTYSASRTGSPTPLHLGSFEFQPHVGYRYSYGDGLQPTPGEQVTTSIHTFSPGLAVVRGDWSVDYATSWTAYSSNRFKDTVSHSLDFSGSGALLEGTYLLQNHYQSSDDPRIETARQTQEHFNFTSASASFELFQRSRLEISLSQDLRSTELAPAEREWSASGLFCYQFSSQLNVGIGPVFGYIDVASPNTDMSYIRPTFTASWKPVEKLSISANAGSERRKFYRTEASSLTTPTFGAAIFYQPIEVTSFSFSANRSVGSAYSAEQITQATSWIAGLQQRLFQRFHFQGSVSHQQSRYLQTRGTIAAIRNDESNTYSASLGTSFLIRGNVSVNYTRVRNFSSLALYTFTSNQVGLQIDYRY